MTYKLYESWGMLGKERRPVYSDMIPATDHYNILTVEMPFPLKENEMGETLIDLDGKNYLLSEVLSDWNDMPCIKWYDDQKSHRVMLDVIK